MNGERWAEFEDEDESMGWTPILNNLLKHQDVSLAAKSAYTLLKSFAWKDPVAFPGRKRLEHESGVGEWALRNAIYECSVEKGIGLIDVKRRGQGKTNLYVFKSFRKWLKAHPFVPWEETEEYKAQVLRRGNQVSNDLATKPQETRQPSVEEDREEEDEVEEGAKRLAPPPDRPNDYVGWLVYELEQQDVFLDDQKKKQYGKHFAFLKRKGVEHPMILRCKSRIVAEWRRIQLTPQEAYFDLTGESMGNGKRAGNGDDTGFDSLKGLRGDL